MHWGSQFMNGLGVNALMPPNFDKTSKQPELKHTAVKIEKLELPWRMTILSYMPRFNFAREHTCTVAAFYSRQLWLIWKRVRV